MSPEVDHSSYLKVRTIKRFDGSMWRQYETPNSIFLLTSLGRRLLRSTNMLPSIEAYINDYNDGKEGSNDARRFLAEGGSARVFSLGEEDLVIKEARKSVRPLTFLGDMQRIDMLIDAVQKHCPRWIDIPSHYGTITSKTDLSRQFTLIKKIDHGVTVGDLISINSPDSRTSEGILEASSLEKFGPISHEISEEVAARFKSLKGHLRAALLEENLSPDEFIPDIDTNPYNVVLERLDTPIADSHLRYWVIDQ